MIASLNTIIPNGRRTLAKISNRLINAASISLLMLFGITGFAPGVLAFADIETILTADDSEPDDGFGHAVAVQGRLAVVGARLGNSEFENRAGAAYIFENLSGVWTQIKKLNSDIPTDVSNFGFSVALDGDTIIVGESQGFPSGNVYVFQRDQGGVDNWGLVKVLKQSAGWQERFGFSVAISGDTIVTGAHLYDPVGCPTTNCGAAYVFERNLGGTDNWGESMKLVSSVVADDVSDGVQFGQSVAISGDTIVVGASHGPEEVIPWPAGTAFIFSRNEGGAENWGEVRLISASDGHAGTLAPGPQTDNDRFGDSVSIDGDTIVVGTSEHSPAPRPIPFDSTVVRGKAYVFERNQGGADNWGEVTSFLASDFINDPGEFGGGEGAGVFIRGDLIVVGDRFDSTFDGAAYLFGRNEGGADNWGEIEKIVGGVSGNAEQFGFSVGTDGVQVIVGAVSADDTCDPVAVPCNNSGAAYVYQPFLDVGVAGGGFSPPKRIDLSKCTAAGTCAKPVKIKVKNFEQPPTAVEYEVAFDALTPPPGGTVLSQGCDGITPVLAQRETFSVPDCTVEFPPGGTTGTFTLNLHTFPVAGIDDDESNNEATKNTKTVP